MSSLKILAAAALAASFGLAFAQGTPPSPSSPNPATGAGQRSTQNTPMGTTGIGGNGGAAAQGSMSGSAAATTAGNVGATTSMSSSQVPMPSNAMPTRRPAISRRNVWPIVESVR